MQGTIILNPNQELLLIKEQKRILQTLNKNSVCAVPVYPLYIFLQNEQFKKKQPIDIKSIISKIRVFSAKIENDDIYFPVVIQTTDKMDFNERIIIGKTKKEEELSKDFELDLKIFRICLTKKENHTLEVWHDIWCKLK